MEKPLSFKWIKNDKKWELEMAKKMSYDDKKKWDCTKQIGKFDRQNQRKAI